MSSECNSPRVHGRLNLEQQRKRAKELLKGAHAGEPEALARIAQHLRPLPDTPKLVDAQRVIALENGFSSWPRLKHHTEALAFARIHAGVEGDRDMETVHIRCGSDIQQGLRIAGFLGDFVEFADPFCTGPVPRLPLAEQLLRRGRFVAEAFGIEEGDAVARMRREYAALERLDDYDRIVLWFEHDSYDQLILAYLLKRIGELRPKGRVELIAVDGVPGVERFVGIGQLAPEVLAWLWPRRISLDEAHFELGERAWVAITAPTPEPLHQLVNEGTPLLPLMAPALARHLRELPELRSGLGLTERLTLRILRERGPTTLGRAFGELMRVYEPLPYLGDAMFEWMVGRLAEGVVPLVRIEPPPPGDPWFRGTLYLTNDGERVLSAKTNRLDLAPDERWIGGVVTPGNGGSWCWDDANGCPVWRPSSGPGSR